MELELGCTSRGGVCVYYEGYSYRKLRVTKSGVVTWVCINQQSKKCYAVIQSKDNLLTSGAKSEHQCGPPDDTRLDVIKRVREAKKRAREEETSLSKVYDDSMGDLHDKG